jgi:choline dehydrogenase-like flavoprotein
MTQKFDGDFIIVGSGPAGISAALPIVEAGCKVVMLDAASDISHRQSQELQPWNRMLGEKLEALLPEDFLSPKLRTPDARRIITSFQSDSQISVENFVSIGTHARGGLSSIWGAFVSEFDDEDLYPWPICHQELRPFYKSVIERIGVSGSGDDDLSHFYGSSGEIQRALPIGVAAKFLFDRYKALSKPKNFAMGIARNAIITSERDGRQACDLNLGCLWGCPRGAVYDSRWDLARLIKFKNFQLINEARAIGLKSISGGWELIILDGRRLYAPRIVLAAGCLGTTKLAIKLMSNPPTKFRLLNNPVLAVPFVLPKRLGQSPSERGFSFAQLGIFLRYGEQLGDYVTGGVYEVSALPPSSFVARLPFSRPAGTAFFNALSSALVVATCYFSGQWSENFVFWRLSADDIEITVRGGSATELGKLIKQVKRQLRSAFRKLGAHMLGASLATPGTDAHYGGTLPMGGKMINGTSRFGELNVAPGVFVVDGASFSSLPAKYPTLTIMANAMRIGNHLRAHKF